MSERSIPKAYDLQSGALGRTALPAGIKGHIGRPPSRPGTLRRVNLDAKRMYSEYKRVTGKGSAGEPMIEIGKQYLADHASELHDLAVIEAHIDGVPINVQKSIVIGKQVLSDQIEIDT